MHAPAAQQVPAPSSPPSLWQRVAEEQGVPGARVHVATSARTATAPTAKSAKRISPPRSPLPRHTRIITANIRGRLHRKADKTPARFSEQVRDVLDWADRENAALALLTETHSLAVDTVAVDRVVRAQP